MKRFHCTVHEPIPYPLKALAILHTFILQLLPVEKVVRPNWPVGLGPWFPCGSSSKIHAQSTTKELRVMHVVDSFHSIVRIVEFHKSESSVLSCLVVYWNLHNANIPERNKRSL